MSYKATINIDRELWDKFKKLCKEEYDKTASELLREMIAEKLGLKRKEKIDPTRELQQDVTQNSYRIRLIQEELNNLKQLVNSSLLELGTDNKTDSKTDSKTELKTDSKTEIKTDNKTDKLETELKTDSKTDSKTELKTDSKTEIKTDNKTDKLETELKTDSKTDKLEDGLKDGLRTDKYGIIEANRLDLEKVIADRVERQGIPPKTYNDEEVFMLEPDIKSRTTIYRYRKGKSNPKDSTFLDRWIVTKDGKKWRRKK